MQGTVHAVLVTSFYTGRPAGQAGRSKTATAEVWTGVARSSRTFHDEREKKEKEDGVKEGVEACRGATRVTGRMREENGE